jgi:hypothetical protein
MVRALPIITVSDHGLGVAVGGLIVSLLELKYFFTEEHDDARIWLRIARTATGASAFSGEMQRLRRGMRAGME